MSCTNGATSLKAWCSCSVPGSGLVAVHPLRDVVPHDVDSDECVCGPRTEPVPADGGRINWLLVHHSLDGREQKEPDHDR